MEPYKIIKHFITLLLLFASSFSFAQTNFRWADSAAVWHFSYYPGIGGGFQKVINLGDTTIAGVQCQQLNFYQEILTQIAPGVFNLRIDSTSVSDVYVYKSNDSVFFFTNNSFHLAFKTNASVGEIWDVSSSQDKVYVRVDSVYYTNYNGISLRDILVSPCDSSGNTIAFSFDTTLHNNISLMRRVNEKFGPMDGFGVIGASVPQNMVYCGLPNDLLCYKSSTFSTYVFNLSTNCENNISLSNSTPIQTSISLHSYPNPVNDVLTVVIPKNQAAESLNYQIFSSLGTLLLKGKLNSAGTIDTQLLDRHALYFLYITSKKSSYQKTFIKN